MEDQLEINAVIVMKREDGLSILDTAETIRSDSADLFNVTVERAEQIRQRLESMGFKVTSGNLNTISVSGSEDDFFKYFGLRADQSQTQAQTQPKVNQGKIPDDLSDIIADIFVPPAPTFYP